MSKNKKQQQPDYATGDEFIEYIKEQVQKHDIEQVKAWYYPLMASFSRGRKQKKIEEQKKLDK